MHMTMLSSGRCRAVAVALLFLGTTGCLGRLKGPAVPSILKTPLYNDTDFNIDVASYRHAATPEAAKTVRDRIVYGVMADIEYYFRDYESNLFINSARFNIGGDFVELALTTAATLGNGSRTKTILSALAGGAAGTRISVDKNFFRQRTFEAIISSMEARRSAVEKRILDQLQTGVDKYPFESAFKDLREYFFAGTLEGGLTELQQQAAASAQMNQNVVSATKAMLSTATSINQALGQMSVTGDYSKLIAFLNAMGKKVDKNTPPEQLQQAYRDLAFAALKDPQLMKKMMAEIRTAQVIQ